jgi:Family of unknown function (DUF5662)
VSLRAHLGYARYVARHKVCVFRAARHLGVPWLGLVHDLSKLRPDEWGAYARWFYARPPEGGAAHAAAKGAFDRAWLAHIHRNKHHPQFWVLRQDEDGVVCLEVPENYVREMVADWMGAGMAVKGHGWDRAPEECRAWWAANKDRSGYAMHPRTRALVERLLAAP